MAYRDFKDLPRHTASDKVLHDIRKCKKCKPYSTFKGYLRYKTITSQNVSSEAQVNNFFILWKSYVPFSKYLSFCILTIP